MRNMNNILLKIIEKKKEDLVIQMQQVSLQKIKEKIQITSEENSFKKNIFGAKNVALIAEIKFASPTNPSLGSQEDLLQRVKEYEKSGADAISIITESHFFKGDASFVTRVKQEVALPVLQKDFVIDEYQIYQAKEIGSDALLLIARLLDAEELKSFVKICRDLGIEPVVEINNDEDLEKAIATDTNIIAVNARDLETFHIDISIVCRLMKKIPDNFIKLGFSGIGSAVDVKQYKDAGARGVLVGTSLMKAKNINSFIMSLRANGVSAAISNKIASSSFDKLRTSRNDEIVKVKICGIRNLESAEAAIAAGAEFLGFNFVPTSKRYIDPKDAKKIINELRIHSASSGRVMNYESRTKFVGVFQNQAVEQVNKIAEMLDFDFVQLHGEEDAEYMKKITRSIIKKMNQGKETKFHDSYFILLDRLVQGRGDMVNLEKAKELAKQYQVFFSGGLTPENVADVVKKVKPFAVDVAGGIETNGQIDNEKVRRFIYNAKNVSLRGGTTKQSQDDGRDRHASLAMTEERRET